MMTSNSTHMAVCALKGVGPVSGLPLDEMPPEVLARAAGLHIAPAARSTQVNPPRRRPQ